MFLFQYSATLAPGEDGGFVATFPDFPEAVAQGETEQEALEQAADSLEEAVANRIVMNLDLPEPSAAPAAYTVAVPVSTAIKAVLYQAIRTLKMSKVQVAAHLGVDEKEVRRLLDPHHPSKLNRIEELLKRLGRRVVIGLQSLPSEATSVPAQLEGAVLHGDTSHAWSIGEVERNEFVRPLYPPEFPAKDASRPVKVRTPNR